MAVSDEVLGNIKGLTSGHEVWSKLKTMYESTTTVNQVQLMGRVIAAQLEDAKSAAEHISTFNGLLNQLQDVGLQIFDDKMKAIFLLMIVLRKRTCVCYSSRTTWDLGLGRDARTRRAQT